MRTSTVGSPAYGAMKFLAKALQADGCVVTEHPNKGELWTTKNGRQLHATFKSRKVA